MSLERHDWNETECNSDSNTKYVTEYMNWITPKVFGRVCDVGSGLGYPTQKYADKENVSVVVTNDKFFDEVRTVKHDKITRYTMPTEDFISVPHEPYDCITATEHIEHLEIPTQFALLEWVKKNLAPGGLFLGSMPDVFRSTNPFHIQEYTHDKWEEILKEHFNQVEVVVLIPNLLYVWQASQPRLSA
jgi:2-polyprenyl-3-methyl-5-hydroxy-6-metoxy-1,4-benzoquinol methylase